MPAHTSPKLADIKLIATDMDGTLLKGWRKDVDPRAFPFIERLEACGVAFFAASGRQYPSLRTLFAPVADRMGYVCENGALVVYRGEVLLKRAMPRADALKIFHAIEEYPDCEPFASGQDTCYVTPRDLALRDHLIAVTKNDVTVVDRVEDIDEPIIKIAFKTPPEKNAQMMARFDGAFGDRYRVVTSGAVWTDVTQVGVDKGTALAAVGERLGIGSGQMLAFGDEMNDREMLDYVGFPYLMDTGNPELRHLNGRVRICRGTVEDELERLLEGGAR